MTDTSNWNLYYNLEGSEYVRANLVYTPYISPDNKTLCMSFNRDVAYHPAEENIGWTEQILKDRFDRELLFHHRASRIMPTLKLLDADHNNRRVFFEWHGDDFFMQGLSKTSYDNVLPDWKNQWVQRLEEMWSDGIYKISLHPNSWVAHKGELIPFNWFFCYNKEEKDITIRSLLIQISSGRQEKLAKVLEQQGIDLDTPCSPKDVQRLAFNSFRSNYPAELIDSILEKHNVL